MSKRRKIRVNFQKHHDASRRVKDLTRQFQGAEDEVDEIASAERVRAKGDLSRKRTIEVEGDNDLLAVRETDCQRGRVLMTQGLHCLVVTPDGKSFRCYVRRLLKSIESEARSVVAAGDWVVFRPAGKDEGMVVRVEPRRRLLTRRYRHREHIIAANIDQVLIVSSLVQPVLKANLVDRYLVSAEEAGVRPIIAFNKVDLVREPRVVVPLIAVYSQLGYSVTLTSATTGQGIADLRRLLECRETVVVGQSGVGKSSLLNALEPRLHLKIGDISLATQKGRHTTTTAQLLTLHPGGTVIDTPGIRQFELWAVDVSELDGHFVEMRPFVPHCRLPGCTHTHEDQCAVKSAVAEGYITAGRYESYLRIFGAVGEGKEAE